MLGRRFGESDLTEMRKLIGFVGNEIEPQFPAWQTVLEIAESGGSGTIGIQFDNPKLVDKKRARKLLGQAGMLPLLHRPLAFLSQGQRRLATIVRALMVKPGILILDEPAAGLDPVAREDFLDKLGTLMTEEKNNLGGPIILYVTHHVEEIIPAFTHALLLRQGRVLSQGPISECLTSANLSKVFGRRVRITKRNGRFSLRLVQRKRSG